MEPRPQQPAVSFFQMSPIVEGQADEPTDDEEFSRFCVLQHESIVARVTVHGPPVYYRGRAPDSLNDKIKRWLEGSAAEAIFCISCHGEEGTGNFSDSSGASRFCWTAALLWDGAGFDRTEKFVGLKALFSQAPPSVERLESFSPSATENCSRENYER